MISKKAQAELNKLHDEADAARLAYVAALKTHRVNTTQVGILRGQQQAAKRDYVDAYTKLGLNRQSAWQVDRVSRGLCRICGNESEAKTCPDCIKRLGESHKKKKLVQP